MATQAGKICISCGRLTNNYVEFLCPNCGKAEIIRDDEYCRKTYTKYRCPNCKFEGP